VKRHTVVLHEQAEDDLVAISRYLSDEAGVDVADRYVEALLAQCERLETSPRCGSQRPDFGAGVRSLVYKRTVTTVYRVRGDTVTIVGFFYRGRDLVVAMRGR